MCLVKKGPSTYPHIPGTSVCPRAGLSRSGWRSYTPATAAAGYQTGTGSANNTAILEYGANNAAILEYGANNTAILEYGANNTAILEYGAKNTAILEYGANNSQYWSMVQTTPLYWSMVQTTPQYWSMVQTTPLYWSMMQIVSWTSTLYVNHNGKYSFQFNNIEELCSTKFEHYIYLIRTNLCLNEWPSDKQPTHRVTPIYPISSIICKGIINFNIFLPY